MEWDDAATMNGIELNSMSETPWTLLEFEEDSIVLDPHTRLEASFVGVGCLGVAGIWFWGIGLANERALWLLLPLGISIALAVLGFWLHSKLSDRYRIEIPDRVVIRERRFFSFYWSSVAAQSDEVFCMIVESDPHFAGNPRSVSVKPPSRWSYGLTLVRQDGKRIRLTNRDARNFGLACKAAERLSQRMGIELHPPQPAVYVKVKRSNPPEIRYVPWSR